MPSFLAARHFFSARFQLRAPYVYESMVTTVILGMLCVHLLCFCVMFLLISARLNGK